MNEYPTPWQRKTMWAALCAVAIVAIGAVAVGLVWLTSRVLGFLQPILIPFAIAAVLAYLLDPVVSKIVAWGTSRQRAVLFVFAFVSVAFVGILFWIIPAISDQSARLVRSVPKFTNQARYKVLAFAEQIEQKYNVQLLPALTPNGAASGVGDSAATSVTDPDFIGPPAPLDYELALTTAPGAEADPTTDLQHLLSGNWIRTTLPAVIRSVWDFIRSSVGGFLGVFGFLLSMIIVPVYLYYFLIESRNISVSWSEYLPLRASAFKDEVVSVLSEINGYLIAFFRGQLLVSLINGVATGLLLVAAGLDFGLLIGLMLCVLGLIPYLGIILCWVPAVLIAALQGGSYIIPAEPWYFLPLVVTGIFTLVQQVDGLLITPKIVGESVGLHPMTVMVSVFVWSLLMGGLLGAILAVPMTATLKVLLKRYIWERRFLAEQAAVTEETFAVQQAQLTLAERAALK